MKKANSIEIFEKINDKKQNVVSQNKADGNYYPGEEIRGTMCIYHLINTNTPYTVRISTFIILHKAQTKILQMYRSDGVRRARNKNINFHFHASRRSFIDPLLPFFHLNNLEKSPTKIRSG